MKPPLTSPSLKFVNLRMVRLSTRILRDLLFFIIVVADSFGVGLLPKATMHQLCHLATSPMEVLAKRDFARAAMSFP